MNFYRSIFRLIEREIKVKLAMLQVLFFITAIFQVAGIASIAPFISMVSDPNAIKNSSLLNNLYSLYPFSSATHFMTVYAIGVVALLIIGNIISSYSLWKLYQISMQLGASVQRKVFNNYLENDYSFFAINNSSKLISQITQEIPRMVYMVVQPMLNLISQLFIASIIVIGLILVDVTIAMIATGLVISIYFLIFKIIRSNVMSYGHRLTILNQEKLKLLDESIAGIKEVKLQGNESHYTHKVDSVTKEGLFASAYIALAGDLPKFVVETIVFSSILGLSIFILLTSGSASNALGIISIYAMAGYKLLPAAQTIYKSYSQVKANGMVAVEIDNEIERSKSYESPLRNLGFMPAPIGDITFNNVDYSYPNSQVKALNQCSLVIKEKKITAFVGASGAGKSTAVDLLLGLIVPSNGEITVGESKLDKSNIRMWRKQIGYVAQDIFILDASFRENIAFGIEQEDVDEEMLYKAAKSANLLNFILSCEGGFDFSVGERGAKLSGGQKQRVGIARALYKDPSIIIFDEATSALDNVTERLIMKDIEKLANTRTVVMIAHRLSTVENADSILVFNDGAVDAQGTYGALANNSLSFQKLISEPSIEKEA